MENMPVLRHARRPTKWPSMGRLRAQEHQDGTCGRSFVSCPRNLKVSCTRAYGSSAERGKFRMLDGSVPTWHKIQPSQTPASAAAPRGGSPTTMGIVSILQETPKGRLVKVTVFCSPAGDWNTIRSFLPALSAFLAAFFSFCAASFSRCNCSAFACNSAAVFSAASLAAFISAKAFSAAAFPSIAFAVASESFACALSAAFSAVFFAAAFSIAAFLASALSAASFSALAFSFSAALSAATFSSAAFCSAFSAAFAAAFAAFSAAAFSAAAFFSAFAFSAFSAAIFAAAAFSAAFSAAFCLAVSAATCSFLALSSASIPCDDAVWDSLGVESSASVLFSSFAPWEARPDILAAAFPTAALAFDIILSAATLSAAMRSSSSV
mmetsp:Transcript_68815/g.163944  ORF Transcript_68815/g.163944 Transcript_68815/m.163944 type:complete len:380 (-) Transcript_68815:502-1641(-)